MSNGRSPVGAECQCANCGLFFSSESAFEKHWTKAGHARPGDVGLVEREGARGGVWGWPGMPVEVLAGMKAAGPERSTRIKSRPETGPEAGTALDGPSVAVRPAEDLSGAIEGSRGPNGGMVARCSSCGVMWERPRTRGRPSAVCPGCKAQEGGKS